MIQYISEVGESSSTVLSKVGLFLFILLHGAGAEGGLEALMTLVKDPKEFSIYPDLA